MKNLLFICTGNSARSIMAEAYMNAKGAPHWRAFSAGSNPKSAPHPLAIRTLSVHGIDAAGARSKSWDAFAERAAPAIDVVVTVCDNAAGEVCPVFRGRAGSMPEKLHWPFPDPAAVQGTDAQRREAFETVFAAIAVRIDAFLVESA